MLSLLLSGFIAVAPLQPCNIARIRERARHEPSAITGRYAAGRQVVFLATCGTRTESGAQVDSIAISPADWGSVEFALRVEGDSFAVADRPHRTVVLERDAARSVSGIRTTGFGLDPHFVRAGAEPALVAEIVRRVPAFLSMHLNTPVGTRRAGADAR